METFSALQAICAGNSPVPGEFPAQRPVTRSFDVFFDLRLNKRLSKQSWGWWFETLSRPLWRQRNDLVILNIVGLVERRLMALHKYFTQLLLILSNILIIQISVLIVLFQSHRSKLLFVTLDSYPCGLIEPEESYGWLWDKTSSHHP